MKTLNILITLCLFFMSTAVVAENNIRTDQLNNKNIEDNIDKNDIFFYHCNPVDPRCHHHRHI